MRVTSLMWLLEAARRARTARCVTKNAPAAIVAVSAHAGSIATPGSREDRMTVTTQEPVKTGRALTHTYTALAHAVRTHDLQDRARGFYGLVFAGLMLALGGAATGLILLRHSWLVLIVAGALGVDLHPVRLSRARSLASADSDQRAGERPDRSGAGDAVRRDQLLVVDDQTHPAPCQPQQARHRSRHRTRSHLLPRGRARQPEPVSRDGSPAVRAGCSSHSCCWRV